MLTFPLPLVAVCLCRLTAVLAGHDTMMQAYTETGKTVTCLIGALQQIDVKQNKCQALILAPTHELAQQIQKAARKLGEFLKFSSHACVGGKNNPVHHDIKILRDGVQIVVGTPGRVAVSRAIAHSRRDSRSGMQVEVALY